MSVIHVAVAVITNEQGEVLIQQRAANTHQGGLWEFPGGKLEQGETVAVALEREINEELGITVRQSRPLIRITHQYADRRVLLDVFRMLQWHGNLHARENQPLTWCKPETLSSYAMPEADVPIVTAINLPESYVITPSRVDDAHGLLQQMDRLLEQGQRLFLYRINSLLGMQHESLAREMLQRCQAHNARLIIHEKNAADLDRPGFADGLHLTEAGLARAANSSSGQLLSVSCHSLDSLRKAQQIGADFALLSPVETTQSHPGTEPLGWPAFREMVEQVNIPVYALGGMTADKINKAWDHGAQGVAGISSWW